MIDVYPCLVSIVGWSYLLLFHLSWSLISDFIPFFKSWRKKKKKILFLFFLLIAKRYSSQGGSCVGWNLELKTKTVFIFFSSWAKLQGGFDLQLFLHSSYSELLTHRRTTEWVEDQGRREWLTVRRTRRTPWFFWLFAISILRVWAISGHPSSKITSALLSVTSACSLLDWFGICDLRRLMNSRYGWYDCTILMTCDDKFDALPVSYFSSTFSDFFPISLSPLTFYFHTLFAII